MINKACENDLKQIMTIVKDIVKEMKQLKNYQWDESYPTRSAFNEDLVKGNLYVYRNNEGQVTGFVCLDTFQPKEYSFPKWVYEKKALVIHRMAVDVHSRGLGIGKALMKYAEILAKENNINLIRSDTYSTNKTMNKVFEKLGYNFTGEIKLMERPLPFNCYEKVL